MQHTITCGHNTFNFIKYNNVIQVCDSEPIFICHEFCPILDQRKTKKQYLLFVDMHTS